jgi:hypothetical protein
MPRLLEGDELGATGHAGAGRRPARVRHDLPFEGVADLLLHARDLPAAGEVKHDLAFGELLEGVA